MVKSSTFIRIDDLFVLSYPCIKIFRVQSVTDKHFYFEEMGIRKMYEVTEWDDSDVTVNIRAAGGTNKYIKIDKSDDLHTIVLETDMKLHKMDQCCGEDVLLKYME